MKRLLGFFFTLLILFGVLIATPLGTKAYNFWYFSPCDTPLPYKFGSIDDRFNISQEQLSSDVSEASGIWSGVYGKPLFIYDPKALLTIGMVYDERQSLNTQINELQGSLQNQEESLKPQEQQYVQASASFSQKLSAFNKTVEEWNAKGGAPKEEYEKLKVQQEELQKEASRLNEMARSLNRSVKDLNSQLGTLNQQVSIFNAALAEKPEEGLYDGGKNTITIYITNSHKELVHTLAHELGHAIGIGHVDEKDSIMYRLSSSSITPSDLDMKELSRVCVKRTWFDVFEKRMRLIVDRYRATQ